MAAAPKSEARAKKAPKLTVDGALRVVEGVQNWRGLGISLWIPDSRLDEISQLSPSERKKALMTYWMENDPFPSWRRLLQALDIIREKAIADSIRHYAEPLTDSTLTVKKVTQALGAMPYHRYFSNSLGVPFSILDNIERTYPTSEQRKQQVVEHYLHYVPGASWSHLAGRLHYHEQQEALQHVQRYVQRPAESTLTQTNLCNALREVEDWDSLGLWLNIPLSKRVQIKQQHSDPAQAKEAMVKAFLQNHPAPSWATVTEALYRQGIDEEKCHHILQEVRKLYGTEMVLPSRLLNVREVQKLRLTPSSDTAPIIILFSHRPLIEMYVSLVTFLLSSENHYPYTWELHCRAGSPTCLYQNCIKFTIPNYAGSVTLIDSSFHFEAHVNAPDTEYCGFVRDAIFTGLKNFGAGEAVDLSHSRPLPELAFICPCTVGSTHAATIGANQKLICVNDSEKWGRLQPNQRVWLTGPDQPTSSAAYTRVVDNREKIVDFLSENTDPEGLAASLEGKGLINKAIKDIARVQTHTKPQRIRPMIDAVISKIELNENFDKFVEVLKTEGGLDELIELITKL